MSVVDVAEQDPGALAGEGEGGRDEPERRHHDRVAGPEVEEQGGHLQRRGARGGEEHLGGTDRLAQERRGLAEKGPSAEVWPLVRRRPA